MHTGPNVRTHGFWIVGSLLPNLTLVSVGDYKLSVLSFLEALDDSQRWWAGYSNSKESHLCFTDYCQAKAIGACLHGRDPAPKGALGGIYGVLNKKRGHVFEKM
ncbi:hypothetical protein IFM89_021265 [Coptis chinensis]|uniref:Uncharacterized protein n=1 Tax=Coptis chinensis TaxID=261450 RepID=A0A835IFP7_9MAGN|nr:hypothetical protein IFM89_021265 [Coptis chinensis]